MPQYISDERGPFGRNTEPTAQIRRAIRQAGFWLRSCTGGVHNFEMVERLLTDETCDIVGAARQSLADPDWFLKLSRGEGRAVRTCTYSNYCEALDQKHNPVTCQLWDREGLDAPGVALTADLPAYGARPGRRAKICSRHQQFFRAANQKPGVTDDLRRYGSLHAYTDCVEVCPVDCFYEGENMLVIDPDQCIDCGVRAGMSNQRDQAGYWSPASRALPDLNATSPRRGRTSARETRSRRRTTGKTWQQSASTFHRVPPPTIELCPRLTAATHSSRSPLSIASGRYR